MSVLAVVALVAAGVWVGLTVARGMFWWTGPRLPPLPRDAVTNPDPKPNTGTGTGTGTATEQERGWPAVTVVVPARDEAEMIPLTLPTLLGQRYPGDLRIVLVDDRSSDGTAALATRIGADGQAPGDRLTVLTGADRPPGWAGKLWALEQGVRHAADGGDAADDGDGEDDGDAADGEDGAAELLLFTDADIAHPPDSVARLVRHAVTRRLDLVSLMARLSTRTRWEQLVIPAFVYLFAQLYPFRLVGRASSRVAAAAGGCVLVRRAALATAGGLAAISGAVIDDVSLGTAVKRSGGRIWLGFADPDAASGVRSVRPYPRLADLWAMISRSAYTQLRHSPAILAGTAAGLLLVYVAPPAVTLAALVWWLVGDPSALPTALTLAGGVAGSALMVVTYLPMVRYHRLPAAFAASLPAVAVLYLLMTLDSARAHRRGGGAAWKGRTYSARVPR